MVVLIILTIHFWGAEDNGHVVSNEACRYCFPSSLWAEAVHKQRNWRFMTPLQLSTFTPVISRITGTCSQSRWYSLLSHRVSLDSLHQSLYLNTVHPSAVCRPWVNSLHHDRFECLIGLESWHQLRNVDLDLAWTYSVFFVACFLVCCHSLGVKVQHHARHLLCAYSYLITYLGLNRDTNYTGKSRPSLSNQMCCRKVNSRSNWHGHTMQLRRDG